MQLRSGVLALMLCAGGLLTLVESEALADGQLAMRGAYYKERSTRVVQPMLDTQLEAGDSGVVNGHLLVDSITSASIAAGASGEAFNERRVEVGGGYLHYLEVTRLGGSIRVSSEPDYSSLTGSLRAERDFAERNTTLGAGVALSRDQITNAGAQGGIMSRLEEDLTTLLLSGSMSQVLSTTTIAGVTYDYIRVAGFQSNPYRSVAAGGMLESERHPRRRHRHATAGTLRQFIPATTTTLFAGYRFYADTWSIIGHTPEARVIQQVVPGLDTHVRYRYHKQSRAYFYRDIYDSADPEVYPFVSDDEKLSNHQTQTIGLRVDLFLSLFGVEGSYSGTRLELLSEYVLQTTDFGNAFIAQVAVAIPFDY